MRFKTDEQREELKKRIDDIALAMVDQTKKSENVYLNSLKERFSSFDDCESLEAELNGIEETFRNRISYLKRSEQCSKSKTSL